MNKGSLYSPSRRAAAKPATQRVGLGGYSPLNSAPTVETPPPAPKPSLIARLRGFHRPYEKTFIALSGALIAILFIGIYDLARTGPRELTQHDIDMAVMATLQNLPPEPSKASLAVAKLRPSVVRVSQLEKEKDSDDMKVTGVGTGVIIDDEGTILTNLHVVAGAQKVGVEFFNGLKTEAVVTGTRPETDLAILKPGTLPDDMIPATLKGTAKLRLGDEVVAIGNPFGIGVSASSGVISGLKRNYLSNDGESVVRNLIQFDAAANPGNSGGPLATVDGEVIGIVTSILNPTGQRVWIGIGFAVPIENAMSGMGESPF